MANQEQIEALYDWLDHFQELRLGKHTDITCAFFDGDFGKTLREAQRDKHNWVLDGINFKPGDRVLDIGSGWGPILKAVKDKGGRGIGLTLSRAQAKYCAESQLDARVQDYKTTDPQKLGIVNGVVSIGALEHFCSEEEFLAGKQDQIYQQFFKFCADVLPTGGRLYLQIMTWGKKVPNSAEVRLGAPKGSDEIILARLRKFYPGSWLPSGRDQLIKDAKHYFEFLHSDNGRLDYIETLNRWDEGTRSLYTTKKIFPAILAAARLIPKYFTDQDFRVQVASIYHNDQQEAFTREIMSHERMFFEKK